MSSENYEMVMDVIWNCWSSHIDCEFHIPLGTSKALIPTKGHTITRVLHPAAQLLLRTTIGGGGGCGGVICASQYTSQSINKPLKQSLPGYQIERSMHPILYSYSHSQSISLPAPSATVFTVLIWPLCEPIWPLNDHVSLHFHNEDSYNTFIRYSYELWKLWEDGYGCDLELLIIPHWLRLSYPIRHIKSSHTNKSSYHYSCAAPRCSTSPPNNHRWWWWRRCDLCIPIHISTNQQITQAITSRLSDRKIDGPQIVQL